MKNIFILLLILTNILLGNKNSFNIYVSPEGNDNNDGMKLSAPVKTLDRAKYIIIKNLVNIKQNVVIYVKRGIYTQQSVVFNFSIPSYSITIQGEKNNIPIFDGRGTSKTWLRVNNHKYSSNNNLHIKNIQIQNYARAILFKGKKNNWGKDVSHNTVKHCRFINIGDKYSKSPIGYAAISLFNSRHNVFEKNEFINIENNKTMCRTKKKRKKCFTTDTHIHAFYMAYYSSYNIIKYNIFEAISGDAIKVRDFSNHNLIEYNSFNNVRRVYQDWYAHYKYLKDEDHIECYSWNNKIQHNKVGVKYQMMKAAPIKDIKTKFYKSSNQKIFCEKSIFSTYKVQSKNYNKDLTSRRVYEHNNTNY